MFVSPTSPVIKKRNYVLIPSLSTAFNFLDHLTYLLLYNHYPCFSISMPFNQPGSNSSAIIGTYNDVAGNQTNTTTINGPVNGKYLDFYYFSTLINESNIHSTSPGV